MLLLITVSVTFKNVKKDVNTIETFPKIWFTGSLQELKRDPEFIESSFYTFWLKNKSYGFQELNF